MRRSEGKQNKLVYGLDIGTRSIVGTVGYLEKDRFIVVAQRVKEHETRAMLDGQIHDIGAVGDTIREVTQELTLLVGEELKTVCIAAAGRVLRTVTTHVETDLEGEKVISKEDIFALDSYGVEKAYELFQQENELDMKFYCVGYTVMRYYMNDYPMGNLENHKAKKIAADLIATFLPDDVVDGLYKAVELAGLEVANLTLEPIAAMEVAIPQMYRMLNIALIDVGAGTSDISITKDGSIVAYGMLPVAGDCLTEDIARHCLVDFGTAETIKRGIEHADLVEYKDIMGIPQKISKEEVLGVISDNLTLMANQAADKIKELNGDKAVSAVFVVGGGGKIESYTTLVAQRLGIPNERCALRGEEVMQKIDFQQKDIVKDSMLVTPIGICLNYYEQSNNFMFVTFNGERIKLYDNNKLAVVDAALQAEFPNEDLFPKRGASLEFTFNGKPRVLRGERGESAEILLNGEAADIHTPIRSNDVIVVKQSTAGEMAQMELGKFPEYKQSLQIIVNGQKITVPKFASVNGELQSMYYRIQSGDRIELLNYYTVEQIAEVMDVLLDENMEIKVNHETAGLETQVYDNFTLQWKLAEQKSATKTEPESEGTKASGKESETPQREETDAEALRAEAKPAGEDESADGRTDARAADARAAADDAAQKRTSASQESRGTSILEKARASAERIAKAPVTPQVEEEIKKAKAYEAAQRISAFATAYNQSGQMPQMPAKQVTPHFAAAPNADRQETAQNQTAVQAEPKAQNQTAVQAEPKAQNQTAEQAEPKAQNLTAEQAEPKVQNQTAEQADTKAQARTAEPADAAAQNRPAEQPAASASKQTSVTVTVNGETITLSGKPDYIYVDVFDHIDFDLTRPQGKTVETLINGRPAQYIEPLKTGDVLAIFWKD